MAGAVIGSIAMAAGPAQAAGAYGAGGASTDLVAPFHTVAPQTQRVAGSGCLPTPLAPQSLAIGAIYQKGDPTFSHLDLPAQQAVAKLMRPIWDFDAAVDTEANRYTKSRGADVAAGACALRMLDSWATSNAVMQLTGHDSYLYRANLISALSFDFMQVRGLNTGDPGQNPRIAAWLRRLGEDTMDHWSHLPPQSMVNLNNHRAWAGLAAAAAGVASQDRRLFAWGLDSYRVVACEGDADGALPRELSRASRARHYMLYTAEPLVMTAELGEANGMGAYALCAGAVHRIASFALRSVDDPSEIERKAGAAQEPFFRPDGSFSKPDLAWVEAYRRRFPDRVRLPTAFISSRPYFAPDLGGDLTALFSP
jgi:poly(beta-D-mannuronate) lyase